ncbi:MAG: hypothetical protein RJQ04_17305 [Longimicrobiales bacterium]
MRPSCSLLGLLLTVPVALNAQTIACVAPVHCRTVVADGAHADLEIELRDHAGALLASHEVFFSTSAGSLEVPATTDPKGRAEARWRGSASSAFPVVVTAWATLPVGPAANAPKVTTAVRFSISLAGAPALGWTVTPLAGQEQVWFSGLALRDSLVVSIHGPTTRSECTESKVAFVADAGAIAAPDTAWGVWGASTPTCVATSAWKLGEFVGEQRLQARLLGTGSRAGFKSVARQAARIAVSVAASLWAKDHQALRVSADTVPRTVTTTTGGTQVTVEDPIVTTDSTLVPVSRGFGVSPVLGADFPIRPKWRRVRLFAGVSLEHPDREFFLGFSPLQAFVFGDAMEATGIDLYVGARGVRITKGEHCGDAVRLCEESDFVIDGPTFMLVADGSKLLSALGSAFN